LRIRANRIRIGPETDKDTVVTFGFVGVPEPFAVYTRTLLISMKSAAAISPAIALISIRDTVVRGALASSHVHPSIFARVALDCSSTVSLPVQVCRLDLGVGFESGRILRVDT
jgi:hypothetical protein